MQGCRDFRIFRPLRDDTSDLRRSELFLGFFWCVGGVVGCCMMIEIAQMALSNYLNKL